VYETHRKRFFPLPDYVVDSDSAATPRVEVSISGRIFEKYMRALMHRSDLDLRQVILLDRVQKHRSITPEEARHLRNEKLIEGRAPNYYISSKVADWTGQKARYIRNRALDDNYYRHLIVEYLQRYKHASLQELDELLLPKLSDVLSAEQKQRKVRNVIQSLRRLGTIRNYGTRGTPIWVLTGRNTVQSGGTDSG